jgi:hypothetical protein
MWGCKPSCSPIRATRGKKGASTRVSQKTLRSSVDDDQVTGNETLCCCITFGDSSLDPCLAGFCTLVGEVLTFRSNLQFPVSRYLKQKTTKSREIILRTNLTCFLDVAQFVGLLAARPSGGWGGSSYVAPVGSVTETVGPISLGTFCVGRISLYRLSTHLSLPS